MRRPANSCFLLRDRTRSAAQQIVAAAALPELRSGGAQLNARALGSGANVMGDDDTGWRVKAWDRALARGVVTSKQVGDLPFDGSVALVDDFSVGEAVEINVTRDGETYRVTKVWPHDPRFHPPQPTEIRAPHIDAEIERRIGALLRDLPVSIDYRVARWGGDDLGDDLVIEGDNSSFSYGAQIEVTLRGASYVELPSAWDGRAHRLANAEERDYLAGRHDLSSQSVAIRFVDDERRVFFVVCEDLTWSQRK